MEEKPDGSLDPSTEQVLYARVLEIGMYVGLGCLFVTFAVYVFGILEPHVKIDSVPECWKNNAHDYLGEAKLEAGWSWVKMLGHGDCLNFLGIAILAGATIFCYLGIIPLLLKQKDIIYAILALLEVLVLLVAASGIIAVGH